MSKLPGTIQDIAQLEALLSEPTTAACEALQRVPGDILVLGAGGKMGPSFCRMLRRASDTCPRTGNRRIIAVSRFSNRQLADELQAQGIETMAGDLLDGDFLTDLPTTPNVVFMTGSKFGTGNDASATWGLNVYLPAAVCQRFHGSRILAFSTGNVYPLVAVDGGGSREDDPLSPVGEYAMSALGRERMFEYFSRRREIPTALVRLNYAVEMRYGVLLDLARQVSARQPVDISMGYANVIWQADANAMACCALADAHSPPWVINVAGPERLDVRATCEQFAAAFGVPLVTEGTPAETALLNNASRAHERYGPPRVGLQQLIEWTIDWVRRGQPIWEKPTMFQVRNGKF